jgi:hypothetical protein
MFIYTDSSNFYRFKDFSSGNQGDGIELVKALFNLESRGHAANQIINDYQDFLSHNDAPVTLELKFHDKFKVVDYEMRHWNTQDSKFWTSFSISSILLAKYSVVPLAYFTMEKREEDGSMTSFKFNKPYLYGYFRQDGELYKIYMPKNLDKKFIKVQNYVQGIDQLTYEAKYLVITSSLKDLMCFNKLGIGNVECIAPDSENTMIGEVVMGKLSKRYFKTIVLFDNDEPGIKAAQRYQDKYGYNYIVLDMSKDLSDSVKDYGVEAVRDKLLPLLKQAL